MQVLETINPVFKRIVQEHYGTRLHKIILYGSFARGDFHEESDVDYLVLLKDEVRSMSENSVLSKHIREQNIEFDKPIQVFVCGKNRFETEANPLFYFIKKEGKDI